jgi:hypothetical protein
MVNIEEDSFTIICHFLFHLLPNKLKQLIEKSILKAANYSIST